MADAKEKFDVVIRHLKKADAHILKDEIGELFGIDAEIEQD